MASLDRNLRRELENAVKKARRVAENGARAALLTLGVGDAKAPSGVDTGLRKRLRAHGRQLGDRLDEQKGTQAVERLVGECAYEHWHRLLFARFLAENDLLVEPTSGMAVSLDECRELARERGVDWLVLASDFAQRMLPHIFRSDDPVLEVSLPPEKRQELESILEGQPRQVFVADDSLGWVYQFWQIDEKETVNKFERKVGADELPAVTQLFTEDYQVLFLLHNTLGAWWASKVLRAQPELARDAPTEQSLRQACAVADIDWAYLRFVRGPEGSWQPVAGSFDSWPSAAKDISLLDPSMGSGHFLVFALPILAALRGHEEQLAPPDAIAAVLRDNIFGLEIDPRCTQIAAFNLAFTAWRRAGFRELPALNLACSGLSPAMSRDAWMKQAGTDAGVRSGLEHLYDLFAKAPTLGSLLDPDVVGLSGNQRHLGMATIGDLRPLVETWIRDSIARRDDEQRELGIVAKGMLEAARLLMRRFTLVATNPPYLVRGKQGDVLKEFSDSYCPSGAADLATVFLKRCRAYCERGGAYATVTPLNWLFLGSYKDFRGDLLRGQRILHATKLGSGATATASWDVLRALAIVSNDAASDYQITGLETDAASEEAREAWLLSGEVLISSAKQQLANPDARIALNSVGVGELLARRAESFQGLKTGDDPRFRRFFWEVPRLGERWRRLQSTVDNSRLVGGLEYAIDWSEDGAQLARRQGLGAWGKQGVAVTQMRGLPCAVYFGEAFDSNVAPLVPRDPSLLPALWAFCESGEYQSSVRRIDQKMAVANATLVKVPFDVERWSRVARERFPNGLPQLESDDPTQWAFAGRVRRSTWPLQTAVVQLLGYTWPGQDGNDQSALTDDDGIACLSALKGEPAAADRVGALLSAAWGSDWSPSVLNDLLARAGCAGWSLERWLRDAYFVQHCELFSQHPFVWHIWDGLPGGFGALVSYHRLAAANGEGRRTLEKLVYTYLGDWIDRQRADQKAGVEGADARVAAAEHLKRELERILEGEPPYDVFARWKPLHQQAVGWDPDVADGIRLNIRPFMVARPLNARGKSACILRVPPKIKWEKDRGKEPSCAKDEFPWFWGWDGQASDFLGDSDFDGDRWNDLHYSRAVKLAARERARVKGGKS